MSLAAASSPLPLRTVTVTSEGPGAEDSTLAAGCGLRCFLGCVDVRVEEVAHRRLNRLRRSLEAPSAYPVSPSILFWKKCPDGSSYRKRA